MKCIVSYALDYLLVCSQENEFSSWAEFCGAHWSLGFHHINSKIIYSSILISGTRCPFNISKLNKLKSSPNLQPEFLAPSGRSRTCCLKHWGEILTSLEAVTDRLVQWYLELTGVMCRDGQKRKSHTMWLVPRLSLIWCCCKFPKRREKKKPNNANTPFPSFKAVLCM